MKPHTPAATVTTNSFNVNHKANHCHGKRALAACQASQKSFAEMLIVGDVAVAFICALPQRSTRAGL